MAEADIMPFEATGEEHPARAGDKLRIARERLGLSRAELSLRTKINERHLAAVEDSDFAALPARIYAVGFARSYAGAVGLDGPATAAQVRRELDERDGPGVTRPAYDLDIEDPAKIPSRRLAWAAAVIGVAALVAGAVFWRSYFVPAVDLPPVRDDALASAMTVPELTPAALVSPSAENAAGMVSPDQAASAPGVAVQTPEAASPGRSQASFAPVAAASPATQSTPAPIPERLEPAPVAAAAAAPATSPGM